jgi:hypothetical protein
LKLQARIVHVNRVVEQIRILWKTIRDVEIRQFLDRA